MGGQLSNLTGSQYQQHVTGIGAIAWCGGQLGVHDARILHADFEFGDENGYQNRGRCGSQRPGHP